jgi:hypothetical protein
MEIIQVPTPAFVIKDDGTVRAPFEEEWNSNNKDNVLYVHSRRYLDLVDFQKEIEKKRLEGATKCFFHSMWTQTDSYYPEPDYTLLWIRCRFYKPKQVTE